MEWLTKCWVCTNFLICSADKWVFLGFPPHSDAAPYSFLYHFPWHFHISWEVSAVGKYEALKGGVMNKASTLYTREELVYMTLPQPQANHDTERPSWAVRTCFALIPPDLADQPSTHSYTYSWFNDVGWMRMDGSLLRTGQRPSVHLTEATESSPSVYLQSLLAWSGLKPNLLVFPWASLFFLLTASLPLCNFSP